MDFLSLTIPGPRGSVDIDPVGGMPSGGINKLQDIIEVGISVAFVFAIIFALFMLIYSGWQWMVSGGEKQKLEQARHRIMYTIVGLVLIFSAFVIINLLGQFFGVDILTFEPVAP